MFKIVIMIFVFLSFIGCMPEPEPNEFSALRHNMEDHRQKMFENSRYDLEHKSNKSSKQSKYLYDEEAELRKQQEIERKRWLKVGIDKDEAEDWKALNLSPKNAIRWKKTGLSYNTIAVLIKEDTLASEAVAFMSKEFDKRPKVFHSFAEPLYEFEASCEKVLKKDIKSLAGINKECSQYVKEIKFNEISGHLADDYESNDLSLEYISKLRQSDSQKAHIQTMMQKKYEASLVNSDDNIFILLFPFLESSPTKEEMFYISKNNFDLKDTRRYKSYEYYEFWINKEKNEEKARVAAIKKQKYLKREKAKRLKYESYVLSAKSYNKMVASECGDLVNAEPSTGEKVHIEGRILNIVGKKNSNVFAYIVKSNKDGKKYLVREPNSTRKVDKSKDISWTTVTVGRVISISIDEDGVASYNHYDDESKEYYTMLRFSKECKYVTKSLRLN